MDFIYGKDYGSYISVLCPFHEDENFGNAFLFYDNFYNVWNFKCFACGKFIKNIKFFKRSFSNNNNDRVLENPKPSILLDKYPYANEHLSYLYDRGITKENIREFNIRLYSFRRILIPLTKDIIEFRRIDGKKPKVSYSKKFDKDFLFNYERTTPNYVFVKEGTTGIFKIYNNISKSVVATLGGNLTKAQLFLFSRFKEIFLNPDLDEVGLRLVLSFFHLSDRIKIIISKDDKEKDYLDSFKIVSYFEGLYLLRRWVYFNSK